MYRSQHITSLPSLPVDHRRTGKDRPRRLEDEHAPEALYKRKQRGAVVLASGGGFQRREERTPAAVRHGLHQSPSAGIQSAAGWVMHWFRVHTESRINYCHYCWCPMPIQVCQFRVPASNIYIVLHTHNLQLHIIHIRICS